MKKILKVILTVLIFIILTGLGIFFLQSKASSSEQFIEQESKNVIIEQKNQEKIEETSSLLNETYEKEVVITPKITTEPTPSKDLKKDPSQSYNAPIGGGRNDDDGPGEFQPEMPEIHDYPAQK